MQNYSVEDDLDIDFFAELKKLQNSSHEPSQAMHVGSDETDTLNTSVCLITDQPLTPFHVVLACGHKFNYEPLYQEVLRQKGRVGTRYYLENIGMNQLKCPYCRNMNNALLPFIGNNPHPVIKRLIGINAPASMCMPGVPCNANKCTINAFYEYAEKQYCYRHYRIAIKAKLVKSTVTANPNTTTITQRCIAENQSGKNKGKQCKLSASEGTSLCKIHAKCNVVVSTSPITSPI